MNTSDLKSLIISLYCLTILYLDGSEKDNASRELAKSRFTKSLSSRLSSLEKAIQGTLNGDFTLLPQLGKELRVYSKQYSQLPQSSAAVRSLLSAFSTWLITDSPSAFRRIHRNAVSRILPSWIAKSFLEDESRVSTDQRPIQESLRHLMKTMTGKPSLGFESIEEAKAQKEKDPETYAKYLALRREFNASWKAALSNLVRQSGEKLLPLAQVEKALAAEGVITTWPLAEPIKFQGKVDADGMWYTKYGEFVGGPPNRSIFPTIRVNPNYEKDGSDYVFQAMGIDGKPGNYFYTRNAVRRAVAEKFQKVRDFIPQVTKIRSKWVALLRRYDQTDRVKVAALVLELLYRTSARIGSPTKNNGLATLLVKNYHEVPNGFRLKYLGKDGVPTQHLIVGTDTLSKILIKAVAELAEGKSPKDRLFSYTAKDKQLPIQPVLVNALFRSLGANGLTVHKLRTFHGTSLFNEEMEKVYSKYKSFPSTKSALEVVKKVALKVGKLLNHVRRSADGTTTVAATTALGSYIDRSAQIAFFQHYKLPLPNYLEKTVIEASADRDREVYLFSSVGFRDRDSVLRGRHEEITAKVDPDAPNAPGVAQSEGDQTEDSPKPAGAPEKDAQALKDQDSSKDSELSPEEEEKLRTELEEGAERVSWRLSYGGDTSDAFANKTSPPDNLVLDH